MGSLRRMPPKAMVRVVLALALSWLVTTGSYSAAVGTSRSPDQYGGKQQGRQAKSSNWAGYADSGATFSDVEGSWTQPAASCTTVSEAAFWVGIDGYVKGDDTVQQIGTDSDCAKVRVGKKKKLVGSYYAWYQVYPDSLVVLPEGIYPVHSGDVLDAEVSEPSSSSITLILHDATYGWTYSVSPSLPSTPLRASAEWIVEAPTAKLTDFGSVTFSEASANDDTMSSFIEHEIEMAKKKGALVRAYPAPSPPVTSGFEVVWNHL
ncbi:MAG TPA: G1 family glutamic endopeptidase [Acidimicrobiales bacterium]|nr:G1 family glutamic endopeptidase [Acidimicrobiales bacterium]